MPIYVYECPNCHREWEAFHNVKDRYLEQCERCERLGKIIPAPSKAHTFEEYVYTNRREGEKVVFTSAKKRDHYLAKRGMHVMDRGERQTARDWSHEYEHLKRPDYKVEKQMVNGRETRVVIPQ